MQQVSNALAAYLSDRPAPHTTPTASLSADVCQCGGHGWVLVGEPFKHLPCSKCNSAALQAELAQRTGIAPTARAYQFKHARKQQEKAASGIQRVMDSGGFVTLWGTPGCGKTYLLICAVNKATDSYVEALYTSTARLLDDLKNTFDARIEGEYERRWRRYVRMPVLALDECDRFNATEWARERFADLVNSRYENPKQVTIFATNADPSAFEPYLWSRMSAKRNVYHVEGADLRREF